MISRITAGAVAGVPERVPLTARLEDEIAGFGEDLLVAEQRSEASFQHEAVLVFPAVAVQRCGERLPGHKMLQK